MVDLHVHILPWLDDGAASMEDALEMADMAVESGVRRLVVTPHSNQRGRFENYCSEELQDVFEEFLSELKRENIQLKVHPGMEIFATEDMAEKIKDGSLMGLNDSATYLVEFPFDADPYWIGNQLEAVRELKKRPLIAHPERYYCVQEFPGIVYEWIKLGCLTQVNKGSILGRFGRSAGITAELLLENNLVTCIASDAHSPYMRTTYMGDVREVLEEHFGEATTMRLLKENPEKILGNKVIPMHGKAPERRKLFFR